MRAPSGENAALSTLSSWPLRTAIALPVFASQIRVVLSSDAVTTRAPSGENAASTTLPSWPIRTAIGLPVFASQIRVVLSSDAVTTRAPSGEKAALLSASSWPRRTWRTRKFCTAALNAESATSSFGRLSVVPRGHAARASFVASAGLSGRLTFERAVSAAASFWKAADLCRSATAFCSSARAFCSNAAAFCSSASVFCFFASTVCCSAIVLCSFAAAVSLLASTSWT